MTPTAVVRSRDESPVRHLTLTTLPLPRSRSRPIKLLDSIPPYTITLHYWQLRALHRTPPISTVCLRLPIQRRSRLTAAIHSVVEVTHLATERIKSRTTRLSSMTTHISPPPIHHRRSLRVNTPHLLGRYKPTFH